MSNHLEDLPARCAQAGITVKEGVTPSEGAPSAVSLWETFRYWLKLGFISFSGPAGLALVLLALSGGEPGSEIQSR